MTTLSVPISAELKEFIEAQIKKGAATNKAAVVRQALIRFREEEAVTQVLRAEQELAEGKILRGDLRRLIKKIS